MRVELGKAGALRGKLSPPADKSISHRAVLFASIAQGQSVIRNFLRAEDTLSTLGAVKMLGVEVQEGPEEVLIHGRGLRGLREPQDVIDCANSGTTMRLLCGLLGAQGFFSVLTGDASLRRRPMDRVAQPLRAMGATIQGREGGRYPPLAIQGGALKGIQYRMPVASAQVKSALLLAGLYAQGPTKVLEPLRSRDHTERMLRAMGAELSVQEGWIGISAPQSLHPLEGTVPGDFSSAAFFLAAALMVPGSELLIENVGVNPTRTGLLQALRRMGARVELLDERELFGEPVADLLVRYSGPLKATDIEPQEVPLMVDEIPVFSVLAATAQGTSTIKGAQELRLKESDRLSAMAQGLARMGIKVEEYPDGLSIQGGGLKGATLESFGDHRVAMAFSVAALAAEGTSSIEGAEAVEVSYPDFYQTLRRLLR